MIGRAVGRVGFDREAVGRVGFDREAVGRAVGRVVIDSGRCSRSRY